MLVEGMPSIAIAGSMAQRAGYGGHAWVFLQYLLGFRLLGYEPVFIDRLTADMATDARGRPSSRARTANIRWLTGIMDRFDLAGSYALLLDDGSETVGLTREQALERVRQSAMLVNVMGFLSDDEFLAAAPRRVFLDIDPGFPQMWRELGQADSLSGHDDFVTIAENIGHERCSIPTCGLSWVTTPQPIALDWWPPAEGGSGFTSIGAWRGPYDPVEYGGRRYGLRAHEFRQFVELPSRTQASFEAALDIDPADEDDLELLRRNSWTLVPPGNVTADPYAYREYIQGSTAELMIAKNMYVQTWSGWFSDRSICFLASGKPVLAEDTGFTHNHPSGEGLLGFSELDEAVDGVEEICGNLERHATAARVLAEDCFDSRKVLGRLLDKLGAR
jgi:hypothetical protein